MTVTKTKEYDPINPDYYNGTDCLEKMILEFGQEAAYWFCKVNAFKYRYRAGSKPGNAIETDLEKAEWYEEQAKNLEKYVKTGECVSQEELESYKMSKWFYHLPREINIFGETWTIKYDDEYVGEDCDGRMNPYSKQIFVSSQERYQMMAGGDNKIAFAMFKETLLHELYHAYFYELGLGEYAADELLVDNLAVKKSAFDSIVREAGLTV